MLDKSKAALLILSKKAPKGEDKEDSSDDMPKLTELMQELGEALKAQDWDGAAKAFEAAKECAYEADEDEDDSEESEDVE